MTPAAALLARHLERRDSAAAGQFSGNGSGLLPLVPLLIDRPLPIASLGTLDPLTLCVVSVKILESYLSHDLPKLGQRRVWVDAAQHRDVIGLAAEFGSQFFGNRSAALYTD